jgi:sugar/nucleoside kinase (ribokinase family)
MPDVLCIGNIQFDVLARPMVTLPRPGTLARVEEVRFSLGGNGMNTAAGLARLGIPTALFASVSRDFLGDFALAQLTSAGVDLSAVTRHPTAGSGVSLIAVGPDGERSITFTNGANEMFSVEDVPDGLLRQVRVLCVGSVFVLPQLTGEALARLFRRARASGATTVLDVCWDTEARGLPFLAPCLPYTSLFAPSLEEGRQLTGREEPEAIAAALLAAGADTVGLKLAARGCYMASAAEAGYVPTMPLTAVDSTGAGDTWLAGVVASLLLGLPLPECGHLANRAAAFAVTGPGCWERVPLLASLRKEGEGALKCRPSRSSFSANSSR